MNAAKKLIASLRDVKGTHQKVSPIYIDLVAIFPLRAITSRGEHETALIILEKLITFFGGESTGDDGARVYLNTLTEMIGHYEKNHYKTSAVTGAEMLAYLMDLQGLRQSDLSKELGGQPVVSKILKGERELNLRQVRALSKRFNVSPGVFI